MGRFEQHDLNDDERYHASLLQAVVDALKLEENGLFFVTQYFVGKYLPRFRDQYYPSIRDPFVILAETKMRQEYVTYLKELLQKYRST